MKVLKYAFDPSNSDYPSLFYFVLFFLTASFLFVHGVGSR